MRILKVLAVSLPLSIALTGAAFAGYDGWVAGGMGIYSATSMSAAEAKDMATLKCSAAEGVACSGAFALSAGSAVVSASCAKGDMSGYVVGQSESAVGKLIESSAFSINDCTMMDAMMDAAAM